MERSDLLSRLGARILAVRPEHPLRVAIDGVDAAGKTMLADELATVLAVSDRPVVRASIDGFHNPAVVRRRREDALPEGYYYDSFDYDALLRELLPASRPWRQPSVQDRGVRLPN